MLVLGISDPEHDSAAVLVDRKRVVAAIEEGKLSRIPTEGGIPHLAISGCLGQGGAALSDLSVAAFASKPDYARRRNRQLRIALDGPPTLSQRREEVSRPWSQDPGAPSLRKFLSPHTRIVSFEHHLCHAASAFYPSGFDRALILTLDESGDMWSGLISLGEGIDLRILRPVRYPNSFGLVYTEVTKLLGFRPHRDEHKTQWLGREGQPDFLPAFRKLFTRDADHLPMINRRYFQTERGGRFGFSAQFRKLLQVANGCAPPDGATRAAIARSAQEHLEEMVVQLADTYRKKTTAQYLCLAGGVFQNVLLVRALEKRAGFRKVFVQPVSGNPGSALGAAYLARKQVAGDPGRERVTQVYWGPEFTEEQVKPVLDNCKTIYRYFPSEAELLDQTVRLLRANQIVAWYQGRMEFGLRALGNRSILASPFSPYVIENLNRYVKHREDFHPFALSVPAETAPSFFDCSENCRFMASVGELKQSTSELRRFAFSHNAIRVHTVEKEANPSFWKLLGKLGEAGPAPVLLNTSFNLFGEPLVCDPRDAIRSLYCSGIDALVIGNFLIAKQ